MEASAMAKETKQVKAAPVQAQTKMPDVVLQRKATHDTDTEEVPSSVYDVLRSPGTPLDEETRTFMESRFGEDFSTVRVHTDGRAAASAGEVNAHAYTVGSDIVFNTGQYAPQSHEGRKLLAHELTHVVQQVNSQIPNPDNLRLSLPNSVSENEAGNVSHSLYQREKILPVQHTGVAIARQDGGRRTEQQIGASDAGSLLRVGGARPPREPYRIIRVAWTLDDGPTRFTSAMQQKLSGIPSTWFIMRSQLGTGNALQAKLKNLREMENSLNEIAIHAMHPTIAHHAWFPVQVSSSVPKAYNDMSTAMADLTQFVQLLRGAGLNIKFVRLPGGEVSEVLKYLQHLSAPGDLNRIARQIISEKTIETPSPEANKVQTDYSTLRNTLTRLGLLLWGGNAGSPILSGNSWEAESSSRQAGLTDDVTDRFRSLVDQFGTPRGQHPRSIVVLAHDTSQPNVEEVAHDIQTMESYALKHGVQVEYYTMSGLYRVVRNQKP
jgi:hypothetical protein